MSRASAVGASDSEGEAVSEALDALAEGASDSEGEAVSEALGAKKITKKRTFEYFPSLLE